MSRSEALRQALVARGVLAPESPPLDMRARARPWFVSLLLGVGGWLAGVFAAIFVALVFQPGSTTEYALVGLLALATAYALYAIDRESAFFDQLALALSIAGQLALLVAGWAFVESLAGIATFATVMQIALFVLMPNRMARLLAALCACIAWALTVRLSWWSADELGAPSEASLSAAFVAWLFVWIPIAVLVQVLVHWEASWMARGLQRFARPALSGMLVALALGTWLSEPFGALRFWDASSTNWLALWPLLGAGAALLAAVNAFRLRHRALVGLGIAGALLHVVHFYFLLGVSLLLKSAILLVVGAALLAVAAAIERGLSKPGEQAP
ncbi:MAG: DUF4401 domain-containing protein [Gammaproteobacteria bacterium]|nr:hypothetical protein [Gammaproteobacteria bacterium]